jgi:dienelactone hydrolase
MARQQATGISPTTIRFGKGVGAVRALPKVRGKRPGVIILHERYGIDQHTKDLTVKLAQAGFVGLAPDLFHRFDGDRKAVLRGEQRVDLTDDGALEDLNGGGGVSQALTECRWDAHRHHRRMPDRPTAAPSCRKPQ